jgi:hypothetical protein
MTAFVLGVGVIVGMAACDGAGESTGETEGSIANGTAGGGFGVVRLRLSDGKTSEFCTGTIIASDRILTAGHCFDTWLTIHDGKDVTYLLQADLFGWAQYTEDGSKWFCLNDPVSKSCSTLINFHVSRLGNDKFGNDVAVIRFGSNFGSVTSADYRLLSTANLRLKQTVVEWGSGFTDTAGTAGGGVSAVMMKSPVRISDVQTTTLKTSDANSQVCKGDSGGPLFAGANDFIVGVLSTGSAFAGGQCDTSTGQATWARITPAVIDFINNNRQGTDAVCHESIAGTGLYACF